MNVCMAECATELGTNNSEPIEWGAPMWAHRKQFVTMHLPDKKKTEKELVAETIFENFSV